VRRAGAQIMDGVLAESLGHLREDDLAELHRLLLLAYGAEQPTPSVDQPGRDAGYAVQA
jgi:hypothetical protein